MICHSKMRNGKLIFKYGTMCSGKSMRLLATAHHLSEIGIPFVIFKSSIDTRDGNSLIHSRATGDRECITIDSEDNLYDIIASYNTISGYEQIFYVLVDECQFLTEKQVNELAQLVNDFGITVECYGLKTDFRTNLFPGSKRLIEISDSIVEIESICRCGENSTMFNARIDESGQIVTSGNQIEIGGEERYVSLCRKCYLEKLKEAKNNEKIL